MTHFIIGTGGHAAVISDILHSAGRDSVAISSDELHTAYDAGAGDVVTIGIGDNFVRSNVARALSEQIAGCAFASAIHPSAVVAADAIVEPGCVIAAGAIVGTRAQLRAHVLINTNASIDHDCDLHDFASVAPGAALGGNVTLGFASAVGIGACVSHGVSIGEHSLVGAGAVVLESLPSFSVCHGSPARVVRARAAGDRYL